MLIASDFSALGHAFIGLPVLVLTGIAMAVCLIRAAVSKRRKTSAILAVLCTLAVGIQYCVLCIFLGNGTWFSVNETHPTTLEYIAFEKKWLTVSVLLTIFVIGKATLMPHRESNITEGSNGSSSN